MSRAPQRAQRAVREVASARVGFQVARVQCGKAKNEFAVFKGVLLEISNGFVHYTAGVQVHVASASVGSPVLLWGMQAVGLSNNVNTVNEQSGPVATPLLDIIAFHLVAPSLAVKWSSVAPANSVHETRNQLAIETICAFRFALH